MSSCIFDTNCVCAALNAISLSSGLVKFNITQKPEVVKAGEKVELVCEATADGKKVHLLSWTDGSGEEIKPSSTQSDGVFVVTVKESELDESKVVVCIVSVNVGGDLKMDRANYTVHVAGELCIGKMELFF